MSKPCMGQLLLMYEVSRGCKEMMHGDTVPRRR